MLTRTVLVAVLCALLGACNTLGGKMKTSSNSPEITSCSSELEGYPARIAADRSSICKTLGSVKTANAKWGTEVLKGSTKGFDRSLLTISILGTAATAANLHASVYKGLLVASGAVSMSKGFENPDAKFGIKLRAYEDSSCLLEAGGRALTYYPSLALKHEEVGSALLVIKSKVNVLTKGLAAGDNRIAEGKALVEAIDAYTADTLSVFDEFRRIPAAFSSQSKRVYINTLTELRTAYGEVSELPEQKTISTERTKRAEGTNSIEASPEQTEYDNNYSKWVGELIEARENTKNMSHLVRQFANCDTLINRAYQLEPKPKKEDDTNA